ncbi:iron ABC transporter permease [Desulfobulbus rhabdoformis]|uniref:FecCD family ABC transporter permease n=1 Tax=Desulfobulbus rhabdoformis TaxID=34032 RepID=UPI001962A5A5|nr:iron ABC transporter permease [Desulfobulbus rhabdoformis]MBM9616735.1 iron ABC transporter permease [Desulfobulbus rhabdoformis]
MPASHPLGHNTELLVTAYRQYRKGKWLLCMLLLPLLLLAVLCSLAVGSADISLLEIRQALWQMVTGQSSAMENNSGLILREFRLPRIVMGILTGMALGASGAVMQVVLRNPLADPYICGISAAAGFGASLAIIAGVGVLSGPYLVIGNAFIFSLVSVGVILMISGRKGSAPQTMVLVGIALLFFFHAMTTILQYFGDSDAVKAAVFWTIGDLGKAGWDAIRIIAPLVVSATLYLCWQAGNLNLVNAGDETAQSLGIHVGRIRILSLIVSTIMVAGIVSFTGTIGFIGLIAPHMVRFLIGNDNAILIPSSALLGAILLVISDTFARTVMAPIILPVGTVTAFLGVPLFVYLIVYRNEMLQ